MISNDNLKCFKCNLTETLKRILIRHNTRVILYVLPFTLAQNLKLQR